MVRTNNILVSTLALSTCCVAPTIGFAPEGRRSHIRLDLDLTVAESSSSMIEKSTNQPLSSISVVDDDEMNSIESGSNLPPVLQQITDERKNFQVNLGKAMDTLRKDMPYILKQTPGKYKDVDTEYRHVSNLHHVQHNKIALVLPTGGISNGRLG
jgi:hypothetical protein